MFHKMPVQIREPTNTMSELVDAIFDRHGDHINDVDASTETDNIELHDVETQCDLGVCHFFSLTVLFSPMLVIYH